MAARNNFSLQRILLAVAFLVVSGGAVWAFQNRTTLVAACLRTIDGVTSKVAHMNEPFGVGASVQPKNPILGVVPDFTLTERSGRSIQKSDLLGGFWVANFIFTRCATSCPVTVMEFTRLQTELPKEVRLVSFSVDPEYDTPAVLADYADKHGASNDRWLFVTGEKTSMYRYIREGFHLSVEENSTERPGFEVTHSPRFALVDPKGRVRGYYDSSDSEDLARLRADIERLLGRDAARG